MVNQSRMNNTLRRMLIKTKISPPAHFHDLVDRTRLISRLNKAKGGQLILLTAPTGYSKTTIVSQWLNQSERAFSWLTLDPKDNDPGRFWRYVFSALSNQGVVLPELTPELIAEHCPSAIINAFQHLEETELNGNARSFDQGTPFVLVLDDFQTLTNMQLLSQLNELLDFLPRTLSLVITSQIHPDLKLSRRRSKDQVIELDQQQLAFNQAESRAYVDHLVDQPISDPALVEVHNKTEGWPAGIQLLSIVLEQKSDHHSLDLSNPISFFDDEVLSNLSDEMQHFLLNTAFLPWLHPKLCDAVLEISNSESLIEQLTEKNLFLVKYGESWRFHDLFKEALNSHECVTAQLRARAVDWFENNGFISRAIDQCLPLKDWQRTITLMSMESREKVTNGEDMTVEGWLCALPQTLQQQHPKLVALRAAIQLTHGNETEALALIKASRKQLHRLLSNEAHPDIQLTHKEQEDINKELIIMESFIAMRQGDFNSAHHLSLDALQHPSDSDELDLFAQMPLSQALIHQGKLTEAMHLSEAIVRQGMHDDQPFPVLMSTSNLIPSYLMLGKLEQATSLIQQVSEWHQHLTSPSPYFPWLEGMKALVEREQGQLTQAKASVDKLLAYLSELTDPLQIMPIYAMAANIYRSLYLFDKSEHFLQQGQLIQEQQLADEWPFYFPRFSSLLIIRALIDKDQALLTQWLEKEEQKLLERDDYFSESERLLLARVYISVDRHKDCIELCQSITAQTEQAQRVFNKARALAITVTCYADQHQFEQCIDQLLSLLLLCEQHHLHQLILDEGLHMKGLLELALPYASNPDYVEKLLALYQQNEALLTENGQRQQKRSAANSAFKLVTTDSSTDTTIKAHQPLIEPLSKREQQILNLISEGLKNQEIADQLFVSITTVKTHVHNIYGKMDVRNRTAAVAKARDLNLLAS